MLCREGTKTVMSRDNFGQLDVMLSPMEQRVIAIENEILRLIRGLATLNEQVTQERIERRKADLTRDVMSVTMGVGVNPSIGDEPFPGSTSYKD